jgi:protein-tyrosine-phosphatase
MGNEGLLRVMFVCRQNSRCSQIAHGLLVDRAPEGVGVSSAGLDDAGGLAAQPSP